MPGRFAALASSMMDEAPRFVRVCPAHPPCCWQKTQNPMNWSPARGMCGFSEHFFVLHCILFHLAPSPAVEGASGKGCFHCLLATQRPAAYAPIRTRPHGRHTRLPTEESSYSLGRRPASRRQFYRSGYSRNQASHGIDPLTSSSVVLRIHRLLVLLCSCRETSSSLNSSPVLSIARMIVSSLRAVATTATFFRRFWPPTIRS